MSHLNYTMKDGVCIVIMDEPAMFDDMAVLNKRQEIDDLVAHHEIKQLLLDFAQVNLTGSAALGMLIRLKAGLAKRGCRLALCRIQSQVAQVLRITQLDQIFEIFDDLDSAIEALQD